MKDRNHLHVFQRNISDLVDLSCSQFDISVGALLLFEICVQLQFVSALG